MYSDLQRASSTSDFPEDLHESCLKPLLLVCPSVCGLWYHRAIQFVGIRKTQQRSSCQLDRSNGCASDHTI